MTTLLEKAVAAVKKLPEKRQKEVAEILMHIGAQDQSMYRLSPKQAAEVRKRLRKKAPLTLTLKQLDAR